MLSRRTILLAAAGALLPLPAAAQSPSRPYRVGILSSTAASERDRAFVERLKMTGYVEGRNVVFDRRYARTPADLAQIARELAQAKVDVIFAPTTVAATAAKKATSVIPIVFATPPDPVGSGLVASLARPGGNATGVTSVSADLNAKRVQLLKEAFPGIARLAVFRSAEPVVEKQVNDVRSAAKALGMATLAVELGLAADAPATLDKLRHWRADSIYVMQSTTNFNNRRLLTDFARQAALPAIFPYSESVEAGGLMSYGADFDHLYERAAFYVDRLLKGQNAAELPVEQPSKFELIINAATAKSLPAKMAPAFAARADRVI